MPINKHIGDLTTKDTLDRSEMVELDDGTKSWKTTLEAILGKIVGTDLASVTTDNIVEGDDNKYFTKSLVTQSIMAACSDETTALVVLSPAITFRMPYAFTLTGVRASLVTAQATGDAVTVDIQMDGTSILSTLLTFDNTEKTTTTATTPAVIATSELTDDAEITVDITQIGDGTATGLKVTLVGYAT